MVLFSVCLAWVSSAQAQAGEPAAPTTAPEAKDRSSSHDAPPEENQAAETTGEAPLGLMRRFVGDQKEIWTSPARLRFSDTEWLVPLSGIAAGLFVTDRDFSKHLSHNPSTISNYKTLSDAGVATLAGGAAGMWLLGHVRHNEHWSETGFLAGEAALKLKEGCDLHAEAFSGAEFLHGPIAMVSPQYPVLLFMPTDAAAAGLQELASQLERKGATVLRTGNDGASELPALPADHPGTDAACLVQSFYGFLAHLAERRGAIPRKSPKISDTSSLVPDLYK